MLAVLAVLLLLSYAVRVRIGGSIIIPWALRLAAYVLIRQMIEGDQSTRLVDSFILGPNMERIGLSAAACLTLEVWRESPAGGASVRSVLPWSGMVLLASCQTPAEDLWPLRLVPLYFLFLALYLRDTSAQDVRRVSLRRILTLAAGVGAGAAMFSVFWGNKTLISDLGRRYLEGGGPRGLESTEISGNSQMGSTFGQPGSSRRVLWISGGSGLAYWRTLAFETYHNNQWGPGVESRTLQDVDEAHLNAFAPGPRAQVTPLAPNGGFLPAPLTAAGIDPGENPNVRWDATDGGVLKVKGSQPAPYAVVAADSDTARGPLAPTMTPALRALCLEVPPEIAPGVRTLAGTLAAGKSAPLDKVRAVQAYLIGHHAYSLSYRPGPGEMISGFLLSQPPAAAHCQFFAASATILLRCQGVPARYVNGYLAHEGDGRDVTVVRERDFHAWCEAWIDGQGWMVVDATPGNGRPTAFQSSVSPWQRLTESLQDAWLRLKARIAARDWTPVALLLVGVIGVGLLTQAAWKRLHRRPSADARRGYTPPDAQLAALAARFQGWMARRGSPCPDARPWRDHLRQQEWGEQAAPFVRAYNAARFGGRETQIAEAGEILQRLERDSA